MGNDDIGVGNGTAARKPTQQMAGAMSQQGGSVLGDNQCTQQELVRLVGCRDPKARLKRAHPESRTHQFGQTKP